MTTMAAVGYKTANLLRCKEDPAALAAFIGLPPLPPHAIKFARIIRENQREGRPVLILACVGHLKSTTLGLLQIQDLMGEDPHILFGSRSSAVVASTGNFLRTSLRRMFGAQLVDARQNEEGYIWQSTAFMTPFWRPATKFPSWFGAQLGTAIEGMRANRGYLDDPIDRQSQTSEPYRADALTWFNNTFSARLNKGATLSVIGSPWHPDDIYMNMINRGFETYVFPMVETKRFDIYRDLPNIHYEGESYKWLWPAQWEGTNIEDLIRKVGGAIPFNQRYLCNPSAILGSLFKPSWFKFYEEMEPAVRARLEIRVGLDPATGKKDTGCLTAFTVAGWDPETGNIYTLESVGEFLDPAETRERARKLDALYKPERILIEDVNYQVDLIQLLARQNLPVFGQGTESRDKVSRISTLAVPIEQGRIIFHKSHQDLVDELLYFPDGKYNDRADSLEIVCRDWLRRGAGDDVFAGQQSVTGNMKDWRQGDGGGRDSEWRLEGPKTDGDPW